MRVFLCAELDLNAMKHLAIPAQLTGYNRLRYLEETRMTEEPDVTHRPSARKWIVLGIGGACALLGCAGLVVALAMAGFTPISSRIVRPAEKANSTMPARNLPVAAVPATPIAALEQSTNSLGDPNAPVRIIEYADFQCPYCREFWQETEPQIIATYVKTGKVLYEYRSVGAFLGPESAAAAQAAYCAGDQARFWQYHDTLFTNWTGENVGDFSNDKLDGYARSVGLDMAAFDACLSAGKYTDRIDLDVARAKADGIHATPSFLINGTLLEGAQPFEAFRHAIDAALQGQ